MAFATVFLLVLAYGVLAPLGHRIRRAEQAVIVALLPPAAGARRMEAARNVINRGWPSLVASELWLLLLLAACIGVFLVWWFVLALPAAGWGLARLLDRVDPFPRTLDWYLRRFLRQAERSRIRAREEGDEAGEARIVALMAELEASLPALGPEAVLPRRRR
jgi:hypothetical protein